jgi:hypothetical protein
MTCKAGKLSERRSATARDAPARRYIRPGFMAFCVTVSRDTAAGTTGWGASLFRVRSAGEPRAVRKGAAVTRTGMLAAFRRLVYISPYSGFMRHTVHCIHGPLLQSGLYVWSLRTRDAERPTSESRDTVLPRIQRSELRTLAEYGLLNRKHAGVRAGKKAMHATMQTNRRTLAMD